ncbi:MAG: hypothetical protein N4A76_01140 [Firmicutes bacterium]|nr:hypothetical protein [Bacillota bacterium]
MKKKILVLCIVLTMLLSTFTYGDIGPKPSVVVDFSGIDIGEYYVTLLSDVPDLGPHYVASTRPDENRFDEEDEGYYIWKKFVDYKDTDDYYFLQYMNECSDSNQFSWTYYPPEKFKILIYLPESDLFIVSDDILERYAFDSYFTAKVSLGEEMSMDISKSYSFSTEIFSLMVRIILTVLIELFIALLFGLKRKNIFRFIVVVNIITQTLLNIILNLVNYKYGGVAFVLNYVWLEGLVIGIEATAYGYYINNKHSDLGIRRFVPLTYAILANVISFLVGLYLAYYIPGVF